MVSAVGAVPPVGAVLDPQVVLLAGVALLAVALTVLAVLPMARVMVLLKWGVVLVNTLQKPPSLLCKCHCVYTALVSLLRESVFVRSGRAERAEAESLAVASNQRMLATVA